MNSPTPAVMIQVIKAAIDMSGPLPATLFSIRY
jgi:hypothetical protein